MTLGSSLHPRLVEEFRTRVKENIEADPLRAVAIVYEEEMTRIKEQLGEGGDLEEFTALCPTLSACTLFISSTPATQVEIDLDTRYL